MSNSSMAWLYILGGICATFVPTASWKRYTAMLSVKRYLTLILAADLLTQKRILQSQNFTWKLEPTYIIRHR